ncbi:uncharacterized protein LOC131882047 isoform X2 [Tigriopus californicus]|uniref:uncharacterized protein LOC131882047 isoform X2 n=1 Tax=Tigriopus californicus TaxID=6832 RepID=UPI0027D9D1BE|nr:uncharacterized protein LOC131882047 isoform X2 [Tigriopus californicus]
MNAPKTLLFLLSCVIGGTLGSTSTRGIQCFVPGECLDSQILDARPTNTSRSCLSLCQGLAGCEWFTWYTDSKVCTSLSGCLSLTEEKCGSNCISGEQECTEIQCGIQGRCYGALEGIRKVGSGKECGSICGQRSECTWFSYSNQTNSCTMTNDCPVLDRSCNDCQASETPCAIDQAYILTFEIKEQTDKPKKMDGFGCMIIKIRRHSSSMERRLYLLSNLYGSRETTECACRQLEESMTAIL